MNRQWHLDARRIVALGAFVGVVAALATVDGLVATMVGVLIVAVYAVVRWRGPRRLRRIAIGTTALVSLSATKRSPSTEVIPLGWAKVAE